MEVRDSRRLTGPNLLFDGAGAVLDIEIGPDGADGADAASEAARAWRAQAQRALDSLGWTRSELFERTFHQGMSLGMTAPIDALYAATEVNEWAWSAALRSGGEIPPDLTESMERLEQLVAEESNPKLIQLAEAAREHGVTLLADDDRVSVGLGRGCAAWPVSDLPAPSEVDWTSVHDVPVAQVTGTNGKTTTVRLLAEMVRRSGLVPGLSSTDWISVGDEVLDYGDYAGPGGARQVLRDARVDIAILETARGGMLRRGLALGRTDVAAINNVAADHLGEFGVHDLEALADCKFVVTRAARKLVLNADDDLVRERGARLDTPVTWFSLESQGPFLSAHLQAGGRAALLEADHLVLAEGGARTDLGHVQGLPIGLSGAARYNVANALSASAVALHLGIEASAIREGLAHFQSTPQSNPGRLNEFEIGGARVLVDFAHNPHGVLALLDTARAIPARRRLVTVGQAGDRDDDAIRELASATWSAEPDLVLIKAMTGYLRGREEGEVPAILERHLRAQGAGPAQIEHSGSELETAQRALEWAEPGDLVILIVHSERDHVLDFLSARSTCSP